MMREREIRFMTYRVRYVEASMRLERERERDEDVEAEAHIDLLQTASEREIF